MDSIKIFYQQMYGTPMGSTIFGLFVDLQDFCKFQKN